MQTLDLRCLAEKWPSAIVAREEIGRFTGGLIQPKSIANLDSLGQGPPTSIKVGRKVAYPVDALIAWLEQRATRRTA